MSGVMVKTGVYGVLRVGWDLLDAAGSSNGPNLPAW
jgi:hypothetical protein